MTAIPTTQEQTRSILEDFFTLIFVQQFDDIFEAAFDKLVKRRGFSETIPGDGASHDHPLDFEQFKGFMRDFRKSIGSRRIMGQQGELFGPPSLRAQFSGTVIGSGMRKGMGGVTGTAASFTAGHTAKISGVRVADGKRVVVSVIAVGKAEVVTIEGEEVAQLALENLVMSVDEAA